MTPHRKLVYIPEINSETFLLFYYEGDSGYRYSFRDYSHSGSPKITYARSYPYTDDQILAMARCCLDAPVLATTDIHSWRQLIEDTNRRFLKGKLSPIDNQIAHKVSPFPVQEQKPHKEPSFPILDLDLLQAHPIKGVKTKDLERIFTSPSSEDYVTWNVIRLLSRVDRVIWWPKLITSAQADNPYLTNQLPTEDYPAINPWQKYPAPVSYELLSRERMAKCQIPYLVARSQKPEPVEGPSEIDIVLSGHSFMIFIEAKLNSDISLSTTYDPGRNQIIRNIDVLLDQCGPRVPYFWMLVKDKGPGRSYTQLMELYRRDPEQLASSLPHRNPEVLVTIAQKLTILRWKDIVEIIQNVEKPAVLQEVRKRIS